MPVRVELRVAQLCGDALLEPFRNEMFKALSFLVNLFDEGSPALRREMFR